MSGASMDWVRDDEESFGEGVWRSKACGCLAPVVVTCGTTLIAVRCGHCHRLVEYHSVASQGWFSEP
jgi:hypothetical protein